MFEWDEVKSAANPRSRGFDFAYAAQVFDSPLLEIADERLNYGEARI